MKQVATKKIIYWVDETSSSLTEKMIQNIVETSIAEIFGIESPIRWMKDMKFYIFFKRILVCEENR